MAKVACTCQQCGKITKIRPSYFARGYGKFCSDECRLKASRFHCVCLQCGKIFKAELNQILAGRKYCDMACARRARNFQSDRACQVCGKAISIKPSDEKLGRGKYCSKLCHGIAVRGERSPFWRGGTINDYGSDWDFQRKLARQRDGGACQSCHRKPRKGEKQFAIHHIIKRRLFAKDDPTANALSNLITLCPQCHPKAERGKIAVPVRLL